MRLILLRYRWTEIEDIDYVPRLIIIILVDSENYNVVTKDEQLDRL